jgi:hypothetical protein
VVGVVEKVVDGVEGFAAAGVERFSENAGIEGMNPLGGV